MAEWTVDFNIHTKRVMCGRLNEDGGYLFLMCKYVKRVWKAMNLEGIRGVLASKPPPKELLRHVLSLKESEQVQVVNLLWSSLMEGEVGAL